VSSHLTKPPQAKLRPARRPGRQAPPETYTGSNVAKYLPAAAPVRAKPSRPARPHPGTPDQARMATKRISGPPLTKASIRVTSNATQLPYPLTATGGAQLGKPRDTTNTRRGPKNG
jgi:hypothetical protein